MGRPPKDGSAPVQKAEREARAETARLNSFTPPPIPQGEEAIRACIEEHAGLAVLEDVAALANVPVSDLKENGRYAVIYARAASWKNIRVGQAQYEKATAKSGSPIPGIAWMNHGIWNPKREPEADESKEIAEIRLTVVDGTSEGVFGGRRGGGRRGATKPPKKTPDAGRDVPAVGGPASSKR